MNKTKEGWVGRTVTTCAIETFVSDTGQGAVTLARLVMRVEVQAISYRRWIAQSAGVVKRHGD